MASSSAPQISASVFESEFFCGDINDEDWSCMVVLLNESDPNLTNLLEQFEKYVNMQDEYPIHIIKPNDLKGKEMQSPKLPASKQIKRFYYPSQDAPEKSLKKIIMKHKAEDLEQLNAFMSRMMSEDSRQTNTGVASKAMSHKKSMFSKQSGFGHEQEQSGSVLQRGIPNDFPKCGPFRYFILSRFYDPAFPEELIVEGIPLVAVFELTNDANINMTAEERLRMSSKSTPNYTIIKTFWQQFISSFAKTINSEIFSDTLLLTINVSEVIEYTNSEERKSTIELLFDFIKIHLFSLTDNLRNYLHYANSMEFIDVPILQLEGLPKLSRYEELLSNIPLECLSVELILYCLIDQVIFSVVESELHDRHSEKQVFCGTNLCKADKDQIQNQEQSCQTIFISHRDHVLKKCNHCSEKSELNLKEIHTSMYKEMPFAKLWKYFPEQNEIESVIQKNQLQKLRRCMGIDLPKNVFINSLHLMYFNKMFNLIWNLEWDYADNLKPSPGAVPPLVRLCKSNVEGETNCTSKASMSQENITKREKQLNVLKKYLECDEMLDLMSLNDEKELFSHTYSEELPVDLLLQVLQRCFDRFTSCDFEYSRLTDCILLWFHNDNDENGIYKSYQEGILETTVGFRDYYVHFSQKLIEWLKEEQPKMKKIEEKSRRKYISRNFSPNDSVTTPEETIIQTPFPGKDDYPEVSNVNISKPVYTSFGRSAVKCETNTTKFYSIDGAILTVQNRKCFREKNLVTINLNSNGNSIYFHKEVDKSNEAFDLISQEFIYPKFNKEVFFHIQTKKGIIISCMAEFIETENTMKPNTRTSEQSFSISFDITITLPNGLMIKFIKGETVFVKQQYLFRTSESKCVNEEDYRIFMSSGTILIFMKNGSVVILQPNSTETRIKSFKKIYPHCPFQEEIKIFNSNEYQSLLKQQEHPEKYRKVYFKIDRHEVIQPNGGFSRYSENKIILSEHKYKLRAAINNSKGLFTVRNDGTTSFIDTNGALNVSFCDGSIISSTPLEDIIVYGEDDLSTDFNNSFAEEISYEEFEAYKLKLSMDHPSYMKVEYADENWTIYLPFGIQITTSLKNNLQINLDNQTSIFTSHDVITVETLNSVKKEKYTRTNFFLKLCEKYENALCSIIDSVGKAFYVSASGETTVFNGMNELTRKSSVFLGRQDSTTCTLRQELTAASIMDVHNVSTRKSSRSWVDLFYRKQHLKYSSGLNLLKPYGEVLKRTSPFLLPKQRNRYFVINRDLTGCEFINKSDNERTLGSYACLSYEIPQECRSCVTTKDFITWSQKPLLGSWSESLLTPCSYDPLLNTGILKCELSPYLPPEKTWLSDLPSKPCSQNGVHQILPLYVDRRPSRVVYLIRNVLDNKQLATSINSIFEEALNRYNKINEGILEKYREQTVPDGRSAEEIEESLAIFRRSAKYLFYEYFEFDYKYLPQGDFLSNSTDSRKDQL